MYQSHRAAAPESELPPYAHRECCGAVAELRHRNNSAPVPAASGFDPPSLSPSLQTTFMPKWLRLVNLHPRPAPAHAPDPHRYPPPCQRFPPCHNERLNAAGPHRGGANPAGKLN